METDFILRKCTHRYLKVKCQDVTSKQFDTHKKAYERDEANTVK